MHSDQLKRYLDFEAEFTREETIRFEETLSESDRAACLHKRNEACVAWVELGNPRPEGVTFRE